VSPPSIIVSRTPFRLTFAGGGTDLPAFYSAHGPGACVAGAMSKGIYVIVTENFRSEEIRVSYRITEDALTSIDAVAHNAIREALRLLDVPSGVQIITATQMPSQGTGIGSSSSCTVGVLNALHRWKGHRVGPRQLAREAVRIEREILREPGGIQDQYIAAYGGINLIEVARDGTVDVRALALDHDAYATLNRHLLLFFTGIERRSTDVHQTQVAEVDDHVDEYVQMRNTAHGIAKALERVDLAEIGRLMDENWQLKKRLSDGISNPAIDRAYALAREHGALGGKLMGAGGGGFLFLLAPPERHDAIAGALAGLGMTPKAVQLEVGGSAIVLEE